MQTFQFTAGDYEAVLEMVLRLICAAFLGGLIGYDREKRMKVAGLKTNALICLGAAVYTSISLQNLSVTTVAGQATFDPNRVIAQIVSGVGFLGAGSIIQSRGSVTGMTTAATIWIVAALGATIGCGFLLQAIVVTLMILAVLKFASPINHAVLNLASKPKSYHVEVISIGQSVVQLQAIFSAFETVGQPEFQVLQGKKKRYLYTAEVVCRPGQMRRLESLLMKTVQVERVSYYDVSVVKQGLSQRKADDDDSDNDRDQWDGAT